MMFLLKEPALAWLGYPFARLLQRRFARDSKGAMLEVVDGEK